MLSEYSCNNITQVNILYNVIRKALDNIKQNKSSSMLS